MSYKYQLGDVVVHFEHTHVVGDIVELLTIDEDSGEPVHELNDELPWYHISWRDPENFIGFECEDSLLPYN